MTLQIAGVLPFCFVSVPKLVGGWTLTKSATKQNGLTWEPTKHKTHLGFALALVSTALVAQNSTSMYRIVMNWLSNVSTKVPTSSFEPLPWRNDQSLSNGPGRRTYQTYLDHKHGSSKAFNVLEQTGCFHSFSVSSYAFVRLPNFSCRAQLWAIQAGHLLR